MFILIAGGGIVGRNIIKQLTKNHDVVVIDKDRAICEKIAAKLGAVAIQGDATNINTLKDAGIERCDYALGVMRYDAENMLFSLLAKNFGVKNIFVRMRDPEYRDAYEIAGATNIAHSVQMMVTKFVLDIENPEIRRVASLGGGKAEVSIVTLPDKADCVGMSISEIAKHPKFPDDVVIAGIFDVAGDAFVVPRGNTVIEHSQQIFLVGARESVRSAYHFLRK